MHTLFLGHLRRHCRDIWGMDVKIDDGDGILFDDSVSEKAMEKAWTILKRGKFSRVEALLKPVLRQLCRETQAMRYGDTKPKLLRNLREYVRTSLKFSSSVLALMFAICREFARAKAKRSQKKKTRVLGRVTLLEARHDMASMELPSWMSTPPKEIGSTEHGKPSADEWRTFCTVNLVSTLIRLWGSDPPDSRRYKMLVNFMDLVTAVKLGSMRTTTPDRIAEYKTHMLRYLKTLLELYQGTTISPGQHLSIHMATLMERFGPTHAWRCWAFERYNYLLQRIPTNMKHGEMEGTMFRVFTMGQNLRGLFCAETLPKSLHGLIPRFHSLFVTGSRGGTLTSDILAFDDSYNQAANAKPWDVRNTVGIPADIFSLLRQHILRSRPDDSSSTIRNAVHVRASWNRLGELLKPASVSPRDSNIIFHSAGGDWSAGRIRTIFDHSSDSETAETFFVVDAYRPLSKTDVPHDPYRKFPIAGGRLFYKSFTGSPVLLTANDIKCHFASSPQKANGIKEQCIHALPLDKVCPHFPGHPAC
ncbi:hypothetical protein PLICRDRAFT_105296 [Plicaturopsis crispa FD-325 SS-3]|nr:hypothetical protein PLICRDRAFT_105296 [Plicaturopsis crispa FD-325 SS-3]